MEKRYFHGIKGLQEILNCTRPTAIRYKKNYSLPHSRIGNKLIWDQKEVLDALKVNTSESK